MPRQRAIFNWSGGKDSALALYKSLAIPEYAVSCLLTSVNAEYQRISMHGVRRELLEQQAASLGIPLVTILIPEMPDMPTYEGIMASTLARLKEDGAELCIFGDIFLEDLRAYREQKLAAMDLAALFPLWRIPTDRLMREFLDAGFKAVVVCVNEKHLDRSFVGRQIDESFLNDLPATVDPCGEYGEYHSFVYDGPIFQKPIDFTLGEVVHRTYTPPEGGNRSTQTGSYGDADPFETSFWYCDLLPA